MIATIQYAVTDLLEQAGAQSRGSRFDCPKCEGQRTITHTEECFYCHKCQWKGNVVTLARELGIHDVRTDEEKRRSREERERTREAAWRLYAAFDSRRRVLVSELSYLRSLEKMAHEGGPSKASWESLEFVYRKWRKAESGLDSLIECATVRDLSHHLVTSSQQALSSESGYRLGEAKGESL